MAGEVVVLEKRGIHEVWCLRSLMIINDETPGKNKFSKLKCPGGFTQVTVPIMTLRICACG
jgi:hypothetical protein